MKRYLTGICISRVAQFGALVIIARSLSLGEAGALLWLLTVATSLSVLLEPGARAAYIREAGLQGKAPTGLIRASIRLQSIAALLACCVTTVVGLRFASAGGVVVGLGVGLGVGLDMIGQVFRAHLQSRELWGRESALEIGSAVLRFGAMAILTLVRHSPTAAAIAFAAGAAVHLMLSVGVSRRSGFVAGNERDIAIRSHFTAIWRLGAATTSSTINTYIDQVTVGVMLSAVAAAQYSVAMRLVQPFEIVAAAIAATLLPQLARRRASGTASSKHLGESLTVILAPMMAIATVLIAFGPRICLALFGPRYASATPIVRLVAPYLLFKALSFWAATCLVVEKRDAFRLRAASGVLGLMIVINPLLIWRLGLRGGAIATVIGETTLAAFYIYGTNRGSDLVAVVRTLLRPISRMLVAIGAVWVIVVLNLSLLLSLSLAGAALALGLIASGFIQLAGGFGPAQAQSKDTIVEASAQNA